MKNASHIHGYIIFILGMFALLRTDQNRQEVKWARDRGGIGTFPRVGFDLGTLISAGYRH